LFKSFCLLLAQTSHHRTTTIALFVIAFAVAVLLRRSRPRTARRLAVATALAGILLVAFYGHALFRPGSARTAIVVVDKTSQVKEGRLVATSRWGLVDQSHISGVEEHIAAAREHLRDPEQRARPLVLEWYCQTLRGAWTVHREYQLINPESFAEADLEDAARAIALQLAFDVEYEQAGAPARTGMRLSAWQFEDLPSALYASIATRDPIDGSATALFARDGWDLVSHPSHAYALPPSASASERAAYEHVRDAHALWSRTDGPLESPFASDPEALTFADAR